MVPGLWLKAKTEAKGDIDKAEAIYAGLRVQSLKDEEDMLRAYQTHTSNPVFMNAGKNKLQ